MNRKVCLALMCLSIALVASADYVEAELLYRCQFKNPEALADWTNLKGNEFESAAGVNRDGAIHLRDKQLSSLELDPQKFKGMIIFEATVKGSKISEPEKPYWGAKAMMILDNGEKRIYAEPKTLIRSGTFNWQVSKTLQVVSENTAKMTLQIGLENADGDYWCDTISIYRAKEVADAPSETKFTRFNPDSNWKGGTYRGFMSGNDLSEAAFQNLAKWNANLLRYQMSSGKNRIITTPEEYLQWIEDAIPEIDRVLVLCKKYGIKMMIDLHQGPVGSRRNELASNIITDPDAVLDQLKKAWTKLAAHYKGNPQIYGYDILNEPLTEDYVKGEKHPWKRISTELVKTIRAIDTDMPIIIEPDLSAVRTLHYIDAPNLIYSVHAYSPIEYTHQTLGHNMIRWTYPGMIQGVKWDREALKRDLMPIREFQQKYNVKIVVGEFSAINWAPGRDKYLEDLSDIFEEFEWDWTYHAYREWAGWSLEHSSEQPMNVRNNTDNPALKAIIRVLQKNKTEAPKAENP